jgi:hypothetical protein
VGLGAVKGCEGAKEARKQLETEAAHSAAAVSVATAWLPHFDEARRALRRLVLTARWPDQDRFMRWMKELGTLALQYANTWLKDVVFTLKMQLPAEAAAPLQVGDVWKDGTGPTSPGRGPRAPTSGSRRRRRVHGEGVHQGHPARRDGGHPGTAHGGEPVRREARRGAAGATRAARAARRPECPRHFEERGAGQLEVLAPSLSGPVCLRVPFA